MVTLPEFLQKSRSNLKNNWYRQQPNLSVCSYPKSHFIYEKINDFDKFRVDLNFTADIYVSLYSWYYMPSSVHILLIHGADICKYFNMILVGKLSEEASETRNKGL